MSDETATYNPSADAADRKAREEAFMERIGDATLMHQDTIVPEWDNLVVRVRPFMDADLDGYDLDNLTAEHRRKLLSEVIRPQVEMPWGMDYGRQQTLQIYLEHSPAGVVRRLFALALRLSGFDAT